jgi:hypothetical protein
MFSFYIKDSCFLFNSKEIFDNILSVIGMADIIL